MWKKSEAVFKHGSEATYLGVATDIKSNVAEAQARRPEKRVAPEPVAGPLELKSAKGTRSKSLTERAEEAAEADNVYERLLEKARRYEEGEEGSGLVDHERKRFDAAGEGRTGPTDASTTLQDILSRIPELALPVVGRPDVEAEREKRRQAKLAILQQGSSKPPSHVIQNLLKE